MNTIQNQPAYPDFLQEYQNLRVYFDDQYASLNSQQKGTSFAEFVQKLVPYTTFGRNYDKPELGPKSHDGGIDLTAHNQNNEVLHIQSKYSLRDKSDFGTIISKFHDFWQKNYSNSAGPLLAFGGIGLESIPRINFQIITLHDLSRIKNLYENSELTSVQFYRQLIRNNQLEIIDGHSILQLLRTAYRRTNILPADFEIEFATQPISWGDIFLGVISSTQLKKLYEEYGDALFFENLRDFLSSTEVNQDIVKTIKEEPHQLLARNNGIVLKATKVELVENRPALRLLEGSVVNGCQTTVSIVLHASEECYVPAKVVKTTTERAWDITRAANFQNQVKRFDLELAQFLRPQIVKKAASQIGVGIKDNLSPSAVIDAISQEDIVYEELRALFIGIFSQVPSNIFNTEYTQLMPNLMGLFYKDDPDGTKLFNSLFTIFKAASTVSEKIAHSLRQRTDTASQDTYRRFFKEDKFSYRAFFTLLTACAVSNIDISSRPNNEQERYTLINNFLHQVVSIITNTPKEFDKYYRFTVQAMSASVKGRDKGEIQQGLWKFMRQTDFNIFLERVHQASDLASSLDDGQ